MGGGWGKRKQHLGLGGSLTAALTEAVVHLNGEGDELIQISGSLRETFIFYVLI